MTIHESHEPHTCSKMPGYARVEFEEHGNGWGVIDDDTTAQKDEYWRINNCPFCGEELPTPKARKPETVRLSKAGT